MTELDLTPFDELTAADRAWLYTQFQAGHGDCPYCTEVSSTVAEMQRTLLAAGGQAAHPGDTQKLKDYWAHGEGAAKIAWAAPCAFCRCLTQLGKYVRPDELKGLCANLEHEATGHWPNAEHSRVHHCPC